MLVLARKFNESIMIGDEIEVIIIEIKNDQVKLGIKAPRKIAVHRKEVYEEIQLENIAALSSKFKPEDLKSFSNFLKKDKKQD
ncbi:MAG: carbon storage regulator CsrA [Spirochaetes bacterium]|nr:carbon storage regulator CsrA [Spirochaetota bacterium]